MVEILQEIWPEQERLNHRCLFFALSSNGNDNVTNHSISISNVMCCFRTCVALLPWGALLFILLLLLDWVNSNRWHHTSTPLIVTFFLLESFLLLAGAYYVVVCVRRPTPPPTPNAAAVGGALLEECDCDESRMSLL
jgi:hypothetical protein